MHNTGERIRDKIAASKKKGMWMGGYAPLGYDIKDRHLVINELEAKHIRTIFWRYLELGSVRLLWADLIQGGIHNKPRQRNGALEVSKPFSRGGLYQLLSNPIYIGKIRHKEALYDGEHSAIIDTYMKKKPDGMMKMLLVRPGN